MKEIIKKIRKTQYLDSKIIYGFGSVFSHAVRKKRRWVCVQVQSEEETYKKEDKRDEVGKFQ